MLTSISIEVKSGNMRIVSISIYLRDVMNVRNAVPVELEDDQCLANERKQANCYAAELCTISEILGAQRAQNTGQANLTDP
jgi:hypothetical protein